MRTPEGNGEQNCQHGRFVDQHGELDGEKTSTQQPINDERADRPGDERRQHDSLVASATHRDEHEGRHEECGVDPTDDDHDGQRRRSS